MSTAAVSSSSIYQELQSYFQQRGSDLQQLGQALQSGDLAGAQQEFSAIQTLGQSGPVANGDPFISSQREQDFQAIGQALQSGDLAGAQQAFAQLESDLHPQKSAEPQPAVVVNLTGAASPADSTRTGSASSANSTAATSSSGSATDGSATGSEIVLNLGTVTPGEQITIGLSDAANGSEQLTIGVSQPNQTPEQITLNLNPNSNQQIILNLFNSTASSVTQGGVRVARDGLDKERLSGPASESGIRRAHHIHPNTAISAP